MPEENIIRAHCNDCGQQTRHGVRATYAACLEDYVEEIGTEAEERRTLEIIQCLGCEQLSIRALAEHEIYGTATPQFYPPRISRRSPRWRDQLPNSIQAMVSEVYKALQSGSPRLATIGARTLIDLVILDKIGDAGTFRDKLLKLEEAGYVGKKSAEFIATALDAGSAAAHRGVAPDALNLSRIMDIVESLLESVYVLDDAASELRKTIPPRK
jgi:hypothetical protein